MIFMIKLNEYLIYLFDIKLNDMKYQFIFISCEYILYIQKRIIMHANIQSCRNTEHRVIVIINRATQIVSHGQSEIV